VEAQFVFVSDLSAAIHDTVTDFTHFTGLRELCLNNCIALFVKIKFAILQSGEDILV